MILQTGTFLQGRYEILGRIGTGGMSEVYKARCHKLNRFVAIKLLKEEFSEDSSFVGKFKLEAKLAASLSHPNIVSVYDVVDEGHLYYIVMELVEGVTLKSYIESQGVLEPRESIIILLQVAQGIAAAHEIGMIHRDIKPQNIILSKDGKIKVADFGIARAVNEQTIGTHAIGSVHYISPEQAKGALADNRSDIYSLGITLYEMLTGRPPYDGENTVSIALAHLEEPMVPPTEYNPSIPGELEQIILICTQKRPERRYGDIGELIHDLKEELGLLSQPEGERGGVSTDTRIFTPQDVTPRRKGHSGSDPNRLSPAKRRSPPKKRGIDVNQEEEEDTRTVDKILSAAGILIAIVIVGSLIFIIGNMGGFFVGNTASTEEKIIETQSRDPVALSTEETTASDSSKVKMPDIRGVEQKLAESTLDAFNIRMRVVDTRYSNEIKEGAVISQSPEAGIDISRYSYADVVISKGIQEIDLSKLELLELPEEEAAKLLEEKGLVVERKEEFSDTVPAGLLISFSPEKVKQEDTVTIIVSKGRENKPISVPPIVGMPEEDAKKILTDAGLKPGNVMSQHSSTYAAGIVIAQSVLAGEVTEKDAKVDYTISLGPPAETRNYKYVASIDQTYNISDLIGPASATTSVSIMIRLKQMADGEEVYTTLMEPRIVKGDTILPVRFKSIEGEYGVDQGEVQVVEVNSGAVLRSYLVEFFRVE